MLKQMHMATTTEPTRSSGRPENMSAIAFSCSANTCTACGVVMAQ